MRVSKLRIYVLKQFDEKKELNNAEIAKLVENEFGKESYSKKQLINLLYNLTKAGVISRKSKGVFCKNVHLEENKVDDDINSFIKHYINCLDVLIKEFSKKMNGNYIIIKIRNSCCQFDRIANLCELNNYIIEQIKE